MCDVPSIAVFCSESIECSPGTVSKFFLKLLVTIPVAPIITGTIVHFRFHIRCISSNYYWYNRTFQVPHSLYLFQLLPVQSYISGSTFVVSLYINSCILNFFNFLTYYYYYYYYYLSSPLCCVFTLVYLKLTVFVGYVMLIIIFINCSWVVTRWQWLLHAYKIRNWLLLKYEIGY